MKFRAAAYLLPQIGLIKIAHYLQVPDTLLSLNKLKNHSAATMSLKIRQLESCSREMFGDMILTCQTSQQCEKNLIKSVPITIPSKSMDFAMKSMNYGDYEKRRASDLMEELLIDIYSNLNGSDYNSATSVSNTSNASIRIEKLEEKGKFFSLLAIINRWSVHINIVIT